MKKFLLALSLLMAYATLHAAIETVDGIEWTYRIVNGKAQIYKSSGSPAIPSNTSGAITIPNKLGDYLVTSIGDYAFQNCRSLTSVTIPEGVTSIGSSAFYNCSSLTSVTIPKGVTEIVRQTFGYCSSLTSVMIPEGVTSIGSYTFEGCSSLNSVTIPSSVTSIGEGAFYGCSSLTSVTIPEGVTSIGNSTFYSCSGLTSVTIPEGVTSIGNSAFYSCSGLTSIEIPMYAILEPCAFMNCSGLTSISHVGGAYLYGYNIFANCTGLKTAHLDSIWEYSDGLFSGCTNLEVVTIGHIEGAIPNSAFYGCTNLTTIDLSQSDGYCSRIGSCAFYNCSSLTTINLPEDLYGYYGYGEIQSDAFNGCKSLKLIKIPDGVSMIHPGAFAGCIGLEEVSIPNSVFEDNYGYGSGIFEYAFDGVAPQKLIAKEFPVNSGMSSKNLKIVIIPEATTEISEAAFKGIKTLESVTFPKSVTKIGDVAFAECENLETVELLSSTISLQLQAFSECLSLTNLIIHGKSTFAPSVFSNCPLLKKIQFLGPPPTSFENLPTTIEYHYTLEYSKAWKSYLSTLNPLVYPVYAVAEAINTAKVSVSAEMTTPTTMKVTYTVTSDKETVKVRAVAFKDGGRSFANLVPVKTAAEGSPEAIPNGSAVTANEAHTFVWNVPSDWEENLAKVAMEILVQEGELLPQELITIPATNTHQAMTITRNTLRASEVFNALLWCIAEGDSALTVSNGVVKVNGTQIASGTSVSTSGNQATALLNYLYGKMGYKVLTGADLTYAEAATRLDLSTSGLTQVAVKIEEE